MKARPSAKRAHSTNVRSTVAAKPSEGNRKRDAKKAKYPDIRRDLERQRASILDEVGEVLTHRGDLEAFPDVSDQASAEVDQNFSMRIRERERKLLKKIDEALERMNAATYGVCEHCGEEIPYKRLKARPVTTFCIDCKTAQEQEERARR
jgi:DnaK suppressor protein